jgi:hypothetical protein
MCFSHLLATGLCRCGIGRKPCAKKIRVFCPHRATYRYGASKIGPIISITHRNSLECLRFEAFTNAKLQKPDERFQGIQNDHR